MPKPYSSFEAFEALVGKTFRKVTVTRHADGDVIIFEVSDDEAYSMHYEPDCCASCWLEDVCGDPEDLVGTPIVRAEQNGSVGEEYYDKPLHDDDESFQWTFYRIGTKKGTVVIRWYGTSNGYYSETPSFKRIGS